MLIEKALIIRRLSNQVSIEYAKLCADSCETFGLDYEYNVAVENLSCEEAFEQTGLVATQSYKNEIKGIRGHCCTTCSHFNCWQRIVELNKTCVVLEHDAILLGDIKNIDIPHDSVVTFGNIIDSPMNYEPIGPAERLEPIGSAKGAHAYALTPRTAQFLIEDARKNGVKTAVDRWLMRGFDDVPHCGKPLYMCDPPQVVSWARISTIQSDRFNKERMTSLMNFDPSLTKSWQAGLKKKIQNAIIVYDGNNKNDIENSKKCAKSCIDNNIPFQHLSLKNPSVDIHLSKNGSKKNLDRFKRHILAWKSVVLANQTSMIIEPDCILFDDISEIMIPNDAIVLLFKNFTSKKQMSNDDNERVLIEISRYMSLSCYALTPDMANRLISIIMKTGIYSKLESFIEDNGISLLLCDPVVVGKISNIKNVLPYKSAPKIHCESFDDIYSYLDYLKTRKRKQKKPKKIEQAKTEKVSVDINTCKLCLEKENLIQEMKKQIDNLNTMVVDLLSKREEKPKDKSSFYSDHSVIGKEKTQAEDIISVVIEDEQDKTSTDNSPTFKTNLSKLRLSLRGKL